MSITKKEKSKERKYQNLYVKFKFTFIEENDEHRPKRVIGLDILASGSMKPSKLKRHLKTKHPLFRCKDEHIFKRQGNSLKVQKRFSYIFYGFTKSFYLIIRSFILNGKNKKTVFYWGIFCLAS